MTKRPISRHLPEVYDTSSGSDLTKFLTALGVSISQGSSFVTDFLEDTFVQTADEEGLDRIGINYGILRPPGLSDHFYRILITTKLPAKRGTLAAIQSVLEAALGGVEVAAYDKQQPGPYSGQIPPFEIWIDIPNGSEGRGAYAGLDSNIAGYPVESCIAGVMLDLLSDPIAGEQNDHVWGGIDPWSQNLVDSVRLAGTILVFFPTL